jgi:soluble lytic murein transglycosylase-like protein
MLSTYFGDLYPQNHNQAKQFVSDIIEISETNNVDPILIASIVQHESGFRTNAKGKKGEVGLMQLNIKNKNDYWTPKKNIEKGIKIFKSKKVQCKNTLHAIEAYISGKCRTTKRAKKRYRLYRLFAKLRK